MSAAPQEEQTDTLELITQWLREGDLAQVAQQLAEMHPAEIAHLLESLPPDQRREVWEQVPGEAEGEILANLNEEVRASLIEQMKPEELVAATEGLETDDLADILPEMPQDVIQELLLTMEQQDRERLRSVLSYDEDTAGGLMNLDTVVVRADLTLDVVLRYLRRRGEIPEGTDNLYVVDREGHYLGLLPLSTLLTSDPSLKVRDVMIEDEDAIPVNMPAREVASRFEQRDLISAPVVDENNVLLGRITIDDVVDVIRDDAEHDLMSMAGLHEDEDMFAPVPVSARRRAVWLGINLITALLAAWVIGLFEATIQQVVALAVLMPIVASMGGIAGSQTLTLVIRGIALGQITGSNARRLLIKELLVSLWNGVIWAVVLGAIAYFWFGNDTLGWVIAAAILINLLIAAIAGATVPLLLRRFGADPALGGGVVLTTITDVVGFFTFLGLATIFLIN
ncbi:MAG TPA: magnesium transporter [Gammaproteobacteria bacterium]|nr:magnesium transporter [Gammaproteobacteria bacterium]